MATYTENLSKALAKQGAEVFIIRMPRFGAKTSEILQNVVDSIPVDKVDLIHVEHEYGLYQNLEGGFYGGLKRLGKPIVTTMHAIGSWDADRVIATTSDRVIVHNEFCARRLGHPCVIIPHGCVSEDSVIVSKEFGSIEIGKAAKFNVRYVLGIDGNGLKWTRVLNYHKIPLMDSFMMEIGTESGRLLKVTRDDKILANCGWIIADNLNIGDTIDVIPQWDNYGEEVDKRRGSDVATRIPFNATKRASEKNGENDKILTEESFTVGNNERESSFLVETRDRNSREDLSFHRERRDFKGVPEKNLASYTIQGKEIRVKEKDESCFQRPFPALISNGSGQGSVSGDNRLRWLGITCSTVRKQALSNNGFGKQLQRTPRVGYVKGSGLGRILSRFFGVGKNVQVLLGRIQNTQSFESNMPLYDCEEESGGASPKISRASHGKGNLCFSICRGNKHNESDSFLEQDKICYIRKVRERVVYDLHTEVENYVVNGIIKHNCSPAECPPAEEAKRSLGIDPRAPIVGYAGFISTYKGIETLVEAMTKVPNAALLIAGGWHAGPGTEYSMNLKRWSLSLLPGRCQWLGWVPDERLATVYGAMQIAVYPSIFITESGALLMALSHGKAVIASDLPAVKEKAKLGALMTFKSRNVKDLRRKIKRLLKDEDLRMKLEEGARKFAEGNSWEKIARLHLSLYEDVIERKAKQ